MKQPLTKTYKYFTTTSNEAESLVKEFVEKHGSAITHKSVLTRTKRTKDEIFDYFIVTITVTYNTTRDLV